MRSILVGVAFLAFILAAEGVATAAAYAPAAAPAADAPPAWTYTLYGSATSPIGWGSTTSSIGAPGPTLFVTTGDALHLHLFSQDAISHTWFIDVDNSSSVNGNETQSGFFNQTTGPIWFNSTVTLSPKTYVYRCGIHPTQMWGLIVVRPAPTFVLWGSYSPVHGWGLTSTSITYPGPTLNVSQGQTVTIDLFSADGVDHTFYVDFARSNSSTGNTVSSTFNGTHSVRFTFVASAAGNFTYACSIHGAGSMKGTLQVAGSSTTPPPPLDYTLYAAVIVVIAIVAIITAVVIRRKPRTPPPEPPASPPSPPQG